MMGKFMTALASWLIALPVVAAEAKLPDGQAVFNGACAVCHQPGGKGMAGLAPPLAGTLGPILARKEGRGYVAQVLVHGLSGRIVSQGQTFNLAMPPQSALSDADLAAAANYIARDLNGSTGPAFVDADIVAARAARLSHKELRVLREGLLQ